MTRLWHNTSVLHTGKIITSLKVNQVKCTRLCAISFKEAPISSSWEIWWQIRLIWCFHFFHSLSPVYLRLLFVTSDMLLPTFLSPLSFSSLIYCHPRFPFYLIPPPHSTFKAWDVRLSESLLKARTEHNNYTDTGRIGWKALCVSYMFLHAQVRVNVHALPLWICPNILVNLLPLQCLCYMCTHTLHRSIPVCVCVLAEVVKCANEFFAQSNPVIWDTDTLTTPFEHAHKYAVSMCPNKCKIVCVYVHNCSQTDTQSFEAFSMD